MKIDFDAIKWFAAWQRGLKVPEEFEDFLEEFEENYEEVIGRIDWKYREILEYLCAGVCAADIAMVLGRSKPSIYGQVRLMKMNLGKEEKDEEDLDSLVSNLRNSICEGV